MNIDSGGTQQSQEPRHDDHAWLDDGNVVLQAENVLFKTLRSILCRESPVFRDMFSMPQPQATPSDVYDACPLVRMPDSAEELGLLLRVVFDANFLDEGCSVRDHILLLGIAAKYQALRVLRRVLVLLNYHYPDTLESHDHLSDEPIGGYDFPAVSRLAAKECTETEDDFLLLKVAHNCGMQILLPASYCKAMGETIDSILAFSSKVELPTECLHNLLIGQQKLHNVARKKIFGPLFGPNRDISTQCKRPLECHEARHKIIDTEIAWSSSSTYHPLKKLTESLLSELCKPCREVVMDAYRRGRAKVWEGLPSVFGLPGWDALRKARDELLGELA